MGENVALKICPTGREGAVRATTTSNSTLQKSLNCGCSSLNWEMTSLIPVSEMVTSQKDETKPVVSGQRGPKKLGLYDGMDN